MTIFLVYDNQYGSVDSAWESESLAQTKAEKENARAKANGWKRYFIVMPIELIKDEPINPLDHEQTK